MTSVAEVLKRNQTVATTHTPIPTFAELGEQNIEPPHTAIITCADPRCHPETFLNLTLADGVIIFRNAGGHVKYALNDIIGLDAFLTVNDIIIIHHTDCGTSHINTEAVREKLKARLPGRNDIDEMSFGDIDDLEQSVRDDLAILKASPFIRKELADRSVGFVYDLKTGVLTPVKA